MVQVEVDEAQRRPGGERQLGTPGGAQEAEIEAIVGRLGGQAGRERLAHEDAVARLGPPGPGTADPGAPPPPRGGARAAARRRAGSGRSGSDPPGSASAKAETSAARAP